MGTLSTPRSAIVSGQLLQQCLMLIISLMEKVLLGRVEELQAKRFHDREFHADMLSARRSDGTELRFIRNERALLVNFVAQPDNS